MENVCISAECCWSPGRVRGRQREPEREKAKWWELEQQQQLLLLLLLHGAAHAWEPALLPARLSEGAGDSHFKVLGGQWHFQELSTAAFFFSCKEHLCEDSASFPGLERYFLSLMCLFYESRYGFRK